MLGAPERAAEFLVPVETVWSATEELPIEYAISIRVRHYEIADVQFLAGTLFEHGLWRVVPVPVTVIHGNCSISSWADRAGILPRNRRNICVGE